MTAPLLLAARTAHLFLRDKFRLLAADVRPLLAIGVATLALTIACSSSPVSAVAPTPSSNLSVSTSPPTLSPPPSANAAQQPAPVHAAIAPPSTVLVSFSALPRGTYPVHLHSRCNGAAGFHIAVMGSLPVSAAGNGAIRVPSSYSGRGLCLIVYANSSLSRVLTSRAI